VKLWFYPCIYKILILYCKRKLLLVKYCIKNKKIRKMEVIKNESYHPLCMQNERNKAAGVHGNKNMEHSSSSFLHWSVIITRNIQASRVKYILPIHTSRRRQSEILSNHHVCPSSLEAPFLSYLFLAFILCLVTKIT